jgi:small subunit ribosomal protein S10
LYNSKKLRIGIVSNDLKALKEVCLKIIWAACDDCVRIVGPTPLPTRRRTYCVLRSPHVNKDSREHFAIRTHKWLIELDQFTIKTIKDLSNVKYPPGVRLNFTYF